MATYKTQKEELQRKYNKELGRIKRLKTVLEKQGYVFPEDNIAPNRPKRITEGSIRKLQRISSKTIARKGLYVSQDTGEVTTGRTQYEKTHKKGNKHSTKKTPKKKAKKTREKYYKESKRKKGGKVSPTEAEEVVYNTFEELTKERVNLPSEDMLEDNLTDEELEKEIKQYDDSINFYNFLMDKINSWEPRSEWSKSLMNIKSRDVNKAARLIRDAVNKYGLSEVATRLSKNSSEISDIIYQIMYMGSGRTFVEEQNKSQQGLVRLESILSAQTLDLKQTQELYDRMDDWEFDEYIT